MILNLILSLLAFIVWILNFGGKKRNFLEKILQTEIFRKIDRFLNFSTHLDFFLDASWDKNSNRPIYKFSDPFSHFFLIWIENSNWLIFKFLAIYVQPMFVQMNTQKFTTHTHNLPSIQFEHNSMVLICIQLDQFIQNEVGKFSIISWIK